jgi:hypothetical protein
MNFWKKTISEGVGWKMMIALMLLCLYSVGC